MPPKRPWNHCNHTLQPRWKEKQLRFLRNVWRQRNDWLFREQSRWRSQTSSLRKPLKHFHQGTKQAGLMQWKCDGSLRGRHCHVVVERPKLEQCSWDTWILATLNVPQHHQLPLDRPGKYNCRQLQQRISRLGRETSQEPSCNQEITQTLCCAYHALKSWRQWDFHQNPWPWFEEPVMGWLMHLWSGIGQSAPISINLA